MPMREDGSEFHFVQLNESIAVRDDTNGGNITVVIVLYIVSVDLK